jgi:hypothetical protein
MKRISQETFDDVVKENIEEFEMDKLEAIKDATEQFRKQGVDLSNIDLTGGEERKNLLNAIECLRTYPYPDETNISLVLEALTVIKTMCDQKDKSNKRNAIIFNEQFGIIALFPHFAPGTSPIIITTCLSTLANLCHHHESIRDAIDLDGVEKLIKLLQAQLPVSSDNLHIISKGLTVVKVISRTEANKSKIFY